MRRVATKRKPTQQARRAGSTAPGGAFARQRRDTGAFAHLQRTIGNQAFQRLLQANPDHRAVRLASSSALDFSRIRAHGGGSRALQPELRVNTPGDRYEQEADRIAGQVMRMPEPGLQRQSAPAEDEELLQTKPLASRITPLVQRWPAPAEEDETLQMSAASGAVQRAMSAEEEDDETLQMKAAAPATGTAATAPPIVQQTLSTPGRPLNAGTRAAMEPRFGADFSRVRVHTDGLAAQSARAVNARAYTVGRNVVFGAGQYAPGSTEGRRLLAHELVHVVQQNGVDTSQSHQDQPGQLLTRQATREESQARRRRRRAERRTRRRRGRVTTFVDPVPIEIVGDVNESESEDYDFAVNDDEQKVEAYRQTLQEKFQLGHISSNVSNEPLTLRKLEIIEKGLEKIPERL